MNLTQTVLPAVALLAVYGILYWLGLPVLACSFVGLVIAGALITWEAKR